VVIDSTPASEFEETRVKARFLTQLDPGFTLFETMLLRGGTLRNLALHMKRLQRSASALGFQYDEASIGDALQTYVQSLSNAVPHRVRLDLHHDGTVDIKSAVLEPLVNVPVKLVMANSMVPASERALLAHKISLRNAYDTAIRDATTRGAFDAIFVNAQGFITEGGRSSLFIKLQGCWYTPALPGGVLPGVMRSRVLGLSKAISEHDIRVEELAQAQGLAVCNALRGVVRAELMPG
jgi:para-aminobenzoate synthetase/4-amino-4-deoxychorismate lyase